MNNFDVFFEDFLAKALKLAALGRQQMGYEILSIDWNGQALSDEIMMVLRNVACHHLISEEKNPVIDFSHDLCEGRITRQGVGVYGTFGGTFFKAELGTVNGVPWTADFLIPRGSEYLTLHDDSVVMRSRPLHTGDWEHRYVDHNVAALPDNNRTVH
jgi:hypothetical protein